MENHLEGVLRVITPLEEEVLDSFLGKLKTEAIDETIIEGLQAAFLAAKLPSAEAMVAVIKHASGDKVA